MGNPQSRDAALSAYASSLIKFKARQLDRKSVLRGMDRDDIAQELTFRLLAELHRYDPERGASFDTFADRVINTAIASLLRAQKRQKRAGEAHAVPLDQIYVRVDDGMATLRDVLSAADGARRTGADVEDRAEAIMAIVMSLPPEEREFALLRRDGTDASVARDMGISRRQVRNIMARLRARFEAAGFGDF